MKRLVPVIFFLAALSALAGYLMAGMSFFGRLGVSLFYKQYGFMKVWWQAALVVFGVLMILLITHAVIHRLSSRKSSIWVNVIAILFAISGLVFNFYDFQHDWQHNWAGERFHMGFYLFWVGWIGIGLYFLTMKKQQR